MGTGFTTMSVSDIRYKTDGKTIKRGRAKL
jgi:hypothetical protein